MYSSQKSEKGNINWKTEEDLVLMQPSSVIVDFYLFYQICIYVPFWQEVSVESLILKWPFKVFCLLFLEWMFRSFSDFNRNLFFSYQENKKIRLSPGKPAKKLYFCYLRESQSRKKLAIARTREAKRRRRELKAKKCAFIF